jgi:hypothetical protein
MSKMVFIAMGPLKGRLLELPDNAAAAAVADKWGQDDTGVTYNPTVFPEIEDPPTDFPQSYVDYFADPFADIDPPTPPEGA